MTSLRDSHAIVVGGGFYGARLALLIRSLGGSVTLVEREPAILGRASLRNQARIHNGYHYPRSILTSLRSRVNYTRFLAEYSSCVDDSFAHYYAVGRGMSKITAAQFTEFCRRIGAPIRPAPAAVERLFDASRIEGVFSVDEAAFDAVRLRARLERDLAQAGVDVRLGTEAVRVVTRSTTGRGDCAVVVRERGVETEIGAQLVLNCAYSGVNHLLRASDAETIPLKHEWTEMALVEPPVELEGAAVTVMDGPFFSLMPYPSRGLFTLSHVRYTPHCGWIDWRDDDGADASALAERTVSRAVHMLHDAERYLPCLRGARYVDSLYEIKTVMPRSEQDDSRPILLRRSAEHPACFSVLGAKIDSVYDVEDNLRALLGQPLARASVTAGTA